MQNKKHSKRGDASRTGTHQHQPGEAAKAIGHTLQMGNSSRRVGQDKNPCICATTHKYSPSFVIWCWRNHELGRCLRLGNNVCTSRSPPVGTGDKQYACALLPANIHCMTIARRQHLTRASSLKAFASKAKAIAAATRGGF